MLYGVTGSGKTHTVFGDLGYRDPIACPNHEPGIIYHSFKKLVESSGCSLSITYVEIYNEQVKDLLGTDDCLMVTENSTGEVSIQGVQSREITTFNQVIDAIKEGNQRRKMAKTCANAFSSRSHAILQINLKRKERDTIISSKLSFLDLAGSERVDVTQNKGMRLAEGSNINKSLLALGKVINTLSDRNGDGYVPYRDSKLTRLLKDSLGGNTRTIMITCITLTKSQVDETIHSLNYSSRAKRIKQLYLANKSQVPTDITNQAGHQQSSITNVNDYITEIDNLRSQVQNLRKQLAVERSGRIGAEMKVKALLGGSDPVSIDRNSQDDQQPMPIEGENYFLEVRQIPALGSSEVMLDMPLNLKNGSRHVSPNILRNKPSKPDPALIDQLPLLIAVPSPKYNGRSAEEKASYNSEVQGKLSLKSDLNLDKIKRILDKVQISIDLDRSSTPNTLAIHKPQSSRPASCKRLELRSSRAGRIRDSSAEIRPSNLTDHSSVNERNNRVQGAGPASLSRPNSQHRRNNQILFKNAETSELSSKNTGPASYNLSLIDEKENIVGSSAMADPQNRLLKARDKVREVKKRLGEAAEHTKKLTIEEYHELLKEAERLKPVFGDEDIDNLAKLKAEFAVQAAVLVQRQPMVTRSQNIEEGCFSLRNERQGKNPADEYNQYLSLKHKPSGTFGSDSQPSKLEARTEVMIHKISKLLN